MLIIARHATIPMSDPLLCNFPLHLERRFWPLGFALDLFTNSESVLVAAEQSWGEFRQMSDQPPVTVRIGISEGNGLSTCGTPVYRGHRNLVSMHGDTGNFAVCDLRQGFGFAWLDSVLAADSAHMRYFYLEAMGYVLISAAWLAPVHAACVEWNGRGILLCGESGAGKSSLAWACARAGWTYVCDDAAFLVRGCERPLVTGNQYYIRFRDTAAALFPEFAGQPVSIRPNGKPTFEIATRSLENIRTAGQCTVRHVLLLDRQAGCRPSLTPFPKDETLRRLSEIVIYGDEDCRDAQRQTLRSLLDLEIWQFRYSDPGSAVACLESMFACAEKIA
jgi:hypothetical protein